MNELKEFRILVGFSQFRLAHEAGVPRQHLQLAEAWLRKLTPEQEHRVRKVLVAELRRQSMIMQRVLAREGCVEAKTNEERLTTPVKVYSDEC